MCKGMAVLNWQIVLFKFKCILALKPNILATETLDLGWMNFLPGGIFSASCQMRTVSFGGGGRV